MLSDNLVTGGLKAGNLVKEAAKLIQGGGGGQPHFATAGGKNPDGLSAAVDKVLTGRIIIRKIAGEADISTSIYNKRRSHRFSFYFSRLQLLPERSRLLFQLQQEVLAINDRHPLRQQSGRTERGYILCKHAYHRSHSFTSGKASRKDSLLSVISKPPQRMYVPVFPAIGTVS